MRVQNLAVKGKGMLLARYLYFNAPILVFHFFPFSIEMFSLYNGGTGRHIHPAAELEEVDEERKKLMGRGKKAISVL